MVVSIVLCSVWFSDRKWRNVMSIARRGARFEQTMKLGAGQALFVNNCLPPLSIVEAKRVAAPEHNPVLSK